MFLKAEDARSALLKLQHQRAPDLDTMFAGIADDLRRCIEPHRLGVEQCRAKHVGMVVFHP